MSALPRPIHCAKCQVDLRPEKNGVWLIELFKDNIEPYAIWHADLWKCTRCGVEIVSGYGLRATYRHEGTFPRMLKLAESEQHYYNYEYKS
jgi:hypothetical protein